MSANPEKPFWEHYRYIDMTGQVYGRLTVVRPIGRNKRGKVEWLCRCECGKEPIVDGQLMRKGMTRSCGCIHMERVTVHGHSRTGRRTTEHRIWLGIITRCENTKNNSYAHYGARGINVCRRWRESFVAFLEDMGPRPSKLHSVHRVNNDGNYEPSNCRWATQTEQSRNTTATRWITFRDETLCLVEWAERIGISDTALHHRLASPNWTLERALTTPNCYQKQRTDP